MHGQLEKLENRTISIFVLDRIILDNLTYLEFSAEEFRICFEYSEYYGRDNTSTIIYHPCGLDVTFGDLTAPFTSLGRHISSSGTIIIVPSSTTASSSEVGQGGENQTICWLNVDPRVQELGYPKIKSFTVTPHVLRNGHNVKCGLIHPCDKSRLGTPNKQGVYDSWGNILAFLTHKRSMELPAFRALWCCPRCWPAQLSLFLWLRHIGRLRKGYGLTTWFQKRYGMDQRHSMFPLIFRGIDIHFPEQGSTRVPGFLLLPRYWCSHSRLQQL